MSRGGINNEAAYAQGKMLDHRGLDLPRNITPSDIDMVVADDLHILYCELSLSCDKWEDIQFGQRKLYEDAVRVGGGNVWASLCRHHVPPHRTIRTAVDIDSFQVMTYNEHFKNLMIGPVLTSGPQYEWKTFLGTFYTDYPRAALIASGVLSLTLLPTVVAAAVAQEQKCAAECFCDSCRNGIIRW